MASQSQQCPLHHHHINTVHRPLHYHHRHHHHHQNHRHCPHCPLHHRHHSQSIFQSHLLPTPLPLPTIPISDFVHHVQPNPEISPELEHIELDDGELDDEPVFVLTDEWREFFAKSEAKRKLEKKQSKKGKK